MLNFTRFGSHTLALAGLIAITGCGGGADVPDLGRVTGTITLDGDPLDGATVEFVPQSGRPSSAITDDNGYYTLRYSATTNGALPGKHNVSIRSARDGVSAEGEQAGVEGRKELLPERYHEKSELVFTVEPGANTADFDLTSDAGGA